MENNNPKEILAFFARGREIGYVLMVNSEIYRYGVKTIKGKRSGTAFVERVAKSLLPLLETIGPAGVVVIERRHTLKGHGALKETVSRIVPRFAQNIYPLLEISLSEAKRSLCGLPKATHLELIETISRRYPLFLPQIRDVKVHQAKYWGKVLMALAMAETSQELIETGKAKV